MKIVLVHDWLINIGGAERVLIELHKIFPQAPIYVLFYDEKFVKEFIPEAEIRTSPLQKIPFVFKIYRFLAFLMPSAVESLDLSEFEVVISSSVVFSKGLVLKPKTKHICYCYSPTRFLWDRNIEYENKSFLSYIYRHFLRIWDRQASDRVDEFVAISKNVQNRIKKYYRRDSKIIYPPLTLSNIVREKTVNNPNFYLIVSRLVPHKNIDIVIDVFNKLGYELIIVGSGSHKNYLTKKAKKNIKFVGYKDDNEIARYYQDCKAFIMPQEEDFGVTPLEAMAFGKPVIALKQGGATETILEGVTGEFFDDPIPEALADGIRRLNENYSSYNPDTIRKHVQKFSRDKFKKEMLKLISCD